jgi:CheY-like chemotaxis protein
MKEHIHILLVEDDPDDVELLKVAFEENEILIQLIEITQGHKVLSYLQEAIILPDIIVLDLNLPKMHGRDVLSEIKSIPEYRDVPVIILTTSSAKTDIDFCMANGASEYIVKPVTMKEYSKIVKAIVQTAGKNTV